MDLLKLIPFFPNPKISPFFLFNLKIKNFIILVSKFKIYIYVFYLSELPVANKNSFGWNSSELTGEVWPLRSVNKRPAFKSQIFIWKKINSDFYLKCVVNLEKKIP